VEAYVITVVITMCHAALLALGCGAAETVKEVLAALPKDLGR
jgi:hypothetical protein